MRNLGAGTYGYSDMVASFVVGSGTPWHDNQGTGQIDPAESHSGHLFNDASAGATSISLVTAAEDTNYQAGDRVLLSWNERQGAASFPPNPGSFEWLEVESVSSGTLTFKTPLRHSYKSQAPDYTSGSLYLVTSGRARILNLDRTGYTQAGTLKAVGGVGVDTGVGTIGYRGAIFAEGAANVTIENGEFEAFFCAATEYITLKNCTFSGGVTELDKVVRELVADGCTFDGISQGTGVESFTMTGGTITGDAQVRAKNILLDGVAVNTDNQSGHMIAIDQYPKELVEAKDCVFTVPSGAAGGVQGGNVVAFTPDSISQTQIQVNSGNAAYTEMVRNIDVGQAITLNTGGVPEIFMVTDFEYDGSDNLLIDGNCEASSPSTAARNLWITKLFKESGNTTVSAPAYFQILSTGRRVWHIDSGVANRVLRSQEMSAGVFLALSVNAYVSRVTVDVTTAYTGADAACTLSTLVQGVGASRDFIEVNGKITGEREITLSGETGAQSGDTLTALAANAWCEELVIHLRGDGGTGAFTDATGLPVITVEIEGTKPVL